MAASPPRTSHLSRQLDLAQLAAELRAPIGLRAVVLGTDALDDLTGLVPARASVAMLTDAAQRCAGVSWIVTVGSGTLADIGKAVSARLEGVAHVVVQTATSVN